MNAVPVLSQEYGRQKNEERWIIIEPETRFILDDCQGTGYRTQSAATRCWKYKQKNPSVNAGGERRRLAVKKFMQEHRNFARKLMRYSWDVARGGYEGIHQVTPQMVDQILREEGIVEPPVTAADILRYA